MPRGDTSLSNYEYDNHLAQNSTKSRAARQELQQRHADRKCAHNSEGVGYHFGLGDQPVKIESREHLRKELDKRGLMLEVDIKKHPHLKRGQC
jgi:hypothetical protein